MNEIDVLVKEFLKLSDNELITEAKEVLNYSSFDVGTVANICHNYLGETLDKETRTMIAVYVGLNKLGIKEKEKKQNGKD